MMSAKLAVWIVPILGPIMLGFGGYWVSHTDNRIARLETSAEQHEVSLRVLEVKLDAANEKLDELKQMIMKGRR